MQITSTGAQDPANTYSPPIGAVNYNYYDAFSGEGVPDSQLYDGQIVKNRQGVYKMINIASDASNYTWGLDGSGNAVKIPGKPTVTVKQMTSADLKAYGLYDDTSGTTTGSKGPSGPGAFGGAASGQLLDTQVPGIFINPNTGTMIDARDPNATRILDSAPDGYEPVFSNGQIVDLKPKPVKAVSVGKGPAGLYVINNDDGSITTITDPSYQPSHGTPVDLGNGLFGIPDGTGTAGSFSSFISGAPSGQKYSGIKAVGNGYVTKVDAAGNPIGEPFQDLTKPNITGTKDLGNGIIATVDANGNSVGTTSAPDFLSPAHLDYMNRSLDASIANDKATLAAQQAEAAMAHGDRLAQIQSQMAQTKMSIASQEKIAGITDKRERAIAIMNAGVTQRGQGLDYLSTTRGQNLNYNAHVADLGQQLLGTAAGFEGTGDTMRTAAFLLGDRGGTTPVEGALQAQQKLVGTMQPLEVNPTAIPIKPIALKAADGMQVLPDSRPGTKFRVLVGDQKGGDGRTATDELVKIRATNHPDAPYAFEGVVPHDQIGDGAKADTRAAGGMTTNTQGSNSQQPAPVKAVGSGLAASGYTGAAAFDTGPNVQHTAAAPEVVPVTDAELKTIMATLDKVDDATLFSKYNLRRVNGQYFFKTMTGKLMPSTPEKLRDMVARNTPKAAAAPATPAAAPAAAPVPATTPTPLTHDDALMGAVLPGGTSGSLDEMRATTAKILHDAFHAPPTPQAGLDVGLADRPLFGETLVDPTQIAYDWTTRPDAVKKTILSAYGLRNLDANEVDRRIRAVTPTSLNYTPQVSWG